MLTSKKTIGVEIGGIHVHNTFWQF
jgi:hypothetical protein